MQETFHLLEFLAKAFRCQVHNFQCLAVPVEMLFNTSQDRVPPGPSSIENDAHDIEKLLLKSQVSEKILV